ncbi:chemotaxis protein CheC [Chitinimonas arctica]|uniref:Chemotaxis protein CheC n=1 Tax=Chitinimonas arctica TaxID=2594795 RepID=A0A516SD69_9NEIS|nr:chemotaxis protein CheC [Chitinimonas arctica]QDQ26080.1 chemotaxis protein CheC [Chitinimonas arctica]
MSGQLSPLQHDALCEIFNISVGRAAAAMSGLVGEEVSLSVPAMRFCAIEELNDRVGWAQWRHVDAVAQHFTGSFDGDALLMFADDDGEEVVRLMLAALNRTDDIDTLGSDALAEVGNVLLNACMSALADIMAEDFSYSLPHLCSGRGVDVLAQRGVEPHCQVLFLHIQFLLESKRIEGYLAFLLGLSSVDGLRNGVDRFLGHLGASVNH